MNETAKDEVLKGEGDAYFKRNLHNGKMEIAKGCVLFEEFLSKNVETNETLRILEIGCCYGYNLIYLCNKYRFEGYGIETSEEAVRFDRHLL